MGKFGRFTTRMVTGVGLPLYRDHVKGAQERQRRKEELTRKERRELRQQEKWERKSVMEADALKMFYGADNYENFISPKIDKQELFAEIDKHMNWGCHEDMGQQFKP